MASGIVKSVTFTPPVSGLVRLKAVYTCSGSGGDFGASRVTKGFMTQSGATTYGQAYREGQTSLPRSLQEDFTVAAGVPVTIGIYCAISGAVASTYSDISICVEQLKR